MRYTADRRGIDSDLLDCSLLRRGCVTYEEVGTGWTSAEVIISFDASASSDCLSLAIFDQYFVIATQILINGGYPHTIFDVLY